MKFFEIRHRVTFEETSFAGTVYWVNHLRWQGRCRETFLHEKAPGVLRALHEGLALITTRCSCEYVGELEPFDELAIRMHLVSLSRSRVEMRFDYWRLRDGEEELVARGSQEIATMERDGSELRPVPLPDELRRALEAYGPES